MTGLNLHLDSSMGCFFIGTLFSIILYGLTCAQVLYYIWEYPTDSWRIRLLVALLWLFDTATTITNSQVIWHYLIQGHSNFLNLTSLALSSEIEYIFAAITILIVQCYYMHHIWRLLRKKWYNLPMTIVMVLMAVVSCACGLWNVYISTQVPQLPTVFIHTKIPASVQPAFGSITDIYITVTLIWALNGERTGFEHTNLLINRLMMYAVNRGIVTALVQFLQFITYITCSVDDFYWAIFHYPGSKIYVNSAIATLNARHYLRSNGRSYLSNGLYMKNIPMNTLNSSGLQSDHLHGVSCINCDKQIQANSLRASHAKRSEASSQTVIFLSSETVRDNGVSGAVSVPAAPTDRIKSHGRGDEEPLGR